MSDARTLLKESQKHTKGAAMSQGTIEQVLGRMLTDDRFRRRAMLSLEETLQKEGYNLSSRELKSIKQVDMLRLEIVAHDMDMVLKRFNGWLPHC